VTRNETRSSETIALDFDGVCNTYAGWRGENVLYDPRPGLGEFLAELNNRGYSVVIFTARDVTKVREWFVEHGLTPYIVNVTNTKIGAKCYVDDRGLRYDGQPWDALLHQIDMFRPHWQFTERRSPSEQEG